MSRGRRPETAVSTKQLEIFLHIIHCVEKNGFQPSLQEVSSHLGINRRAAHDRLAILARKNWVELGGNRDRAIELVGVTFKAIFDQERTKAMGSLDTQSKESE